jgi:hypothetical protein
MAFTLYIIVQVAAKVLASGGVLLKFPCNIRRIVAFSKVCFIGVDHLMSMAHVEFCVS